MSGHSQLSFRGLLFGPVIVRCARRSVLDLVNMEHVHFDSHVSRVICVACSSQLHVIFSQIMFHGRKDSSSKIHLWGVKRSFLEFIYCSRVGHVRTTLVDWEDICHN